MFGMAAGTRGSGVAARLLALSALPTPGVGTPSTGLSEALKVALKVACAVTCVLPKRRS